ncbi:MAG: hypothetical protein WC612_07475 [Bdellovibrionales bacterium]|jgi:hypothetical protein
MVGRFFKKVAASLTQPAKAALVGLTLLTSVMQVGCATTPTNAPHGKNVFLGNLWVGEFHNPVDASRDSWEEAKERLHDQYGRPAYKGDRYSCRRDQSDDSFVCVDKATRAYYRCYKRDGGNGERLCRPL